MNRLEFNRYALKRLDLLLLALIAIFAGIAVARATGSAPTRPGAGYWHTSGTRILDANDQTVRIAAVTWYGMETSYWVPAGLNFQPYTTIMKTVKTLGYNTIRLPYSNELVETNPIVTAQIRANRQLAGMHALDVLDRLVAYAHRIGLKIILDNHLCRASRPKNVNYLLEPLWYTDAYPESSWIHDWQSLARRYNGDSAVIGFDLRNEPHTAGPGLWDLQGYLNRGATWGPYRGVENGGTDWHLAAQRAGNAVLAINPRLLMFVEGLQLYPDAHQPNGAAVYWWGSNLMPVRQYPVLFTVPHQLVYSPHDWGPWKWNMPWFTNMTYKSMELVWHQYWSFLLDDPNSTIAAPVWIGEFGTCTNNPGCVDRQRSGNQATWFHLLLRYLREHTEVGWSFYALNGTNANDSPANNGILNQRWSGVANAELQRDLTGIQN
ncbi:MAG: hypothetical protein NVSMB52_07230 [Chloroflexota bacterium]